MDHRGVWLPLDKERFVCYFRRFYVENSHPNCCVFFVSPENSLNDKDPYKMYVVGPIDKERAEGISLSVSYH